MELEKEEQEIIVIPKNLQDKIHLVWYMLDEVMCFMDEISDELGIKKFEKEEEEDET